MSSGAIHNYSRRLGPHRVFRPAGSWVRGAVAQGFDEVADVFAQSFLDREEVGASLCIRVEGETVVDLWGGTADISTGRQWDESTVSVMFSCTKAAAALCIHRLSALGLLGIDDRVCHYWPEFESSGKRDITVRMVLDHTAGIPVLLQPLKEDCLEDSDYMAAMIAGQAPLWQPGSVHAYHAVTFGFVLGELVRRTTGCSIGQFFEREIAGPSGFEFWIGLPQAMESRIAAILPPTAAGTPQTAFARALADKNSIPSLFIYNSGDWARRGVHTRSGRKAEIASANGVTNARGLTGLYEMLIPGARAEFGPLLRHMRDACSRRRPSADRTLMLPTRFDSGFMLRMDNRTSIDDRSSFVCGEHAFGHCGSGGSVGFVDPAMRMSFGYTMNRLGSGVLVNDRGQALIGAAYRALSELNP